MHLMAIDGDNMWMVAAVWMTLATIGALLAIRFKSVVALVEIVIGILAGNLIDLHSNAWIDFIAGFGSILLTFLAGAEIDPTILRSQLLPAVTLGTMSFFLPFLAAGAYALFAMHWTLDAAKIAGIAMSTTSVAVVYTVVVEAGIVESRFGQLILAVCFFTDMGTVVALALLFSTYNWWLAFLVAAIIAAFILVPKIIPIVIARTQHSVSEPAFRVLFSIVFFLSALATYAHSEGVLPAYFLGLGCAGMLTAHEEMKRRLQTMTMTLLTPFFFIKAGTYVSLREAAGEIGLIASLFAVKVSAKVAGVLPPALLFGYPPRDAKYLTLVMTTGLTFGTIASLYGLTHHYINSAQYTALVTGVILTAIVPTFLAQAFFLPATQTRTTKNEIPPEVT